MHHGFALVAALLFLTPGLAHAQATGVLGKFLDSGTREAIAGLPVKMTRAGDSTAVHRATTRDDGSFEITGLGTHSYWLEAARVGFAPYKQLVRVTRARQDLGVLGLVEESVPVPGITVTQTLPPAAQKEDTTEYRAGAVKTHRDATAEDLVQKLPGVTIEGGQVRAQGQQVQQVMVNGRPFFGSDPTLAMRNLPAEVVDRIQIYDRMSDQAEFSGFDDGQAQRTMNFILRDQKLRFGRANAGYGDDDRYQAGGNYTLVRGLTRFTLLGMSNNINQRNFSPQDLFGALTGGGGGMRMMMLGGGGGHRGGGWNPGAMIRLGGGFGGGAFDPSSFLVGQVPGISTTHSGGVNYAGHWGPKLAVTSSLFANDTGTDNVQTLARQYLPPQGTLAHFDQDITSSTRNGNQRLDARVEWTIDSLNSVIVQPRLYFQNNKTRSLGRAANTDLAGAPLNAATSDLSDVLEGDNLSTRITLRHRFAKRGRNVSADVNVGRTLRDARNRQYSLTDYHQGSSTTSDTLDQRSTSDTRTNALSTRIAFTEPLRPNWQLQAIYSPSLTTSDADARTLRFDPVAGDYLRPDSALSNSFANRTTAQNGGLALLYSRAPWRLLTNVSYQSTRLRSEQTYPLARTIDHGFGDVLPSATLTGTVNNRRHIRLAWNTSTQAPSISQLQNVVNNSNPLSLTTGNPRLRPTYANTVSLRVSEAEPALSRSKFLFANVTRTSRPISNSIFIAPFDTTVSGVFIARGTQLTMPVNLEHSWSANLFGVYSRPTPWVKSILSLSGGGTVNRVPTRINGRTSFGTTYAVRSGAVFASNISERLDFTVSYWSTYNITRNTVTTGTTGDYFTHIAALRLNAVVGRGIVVRQEVTHDLRSGLPSAYGRDVVLWNSTIGKKMLKDERGELRVTATDALRQNRSVSRSLTESYVQDTRDLTLGRYVQGVFTYTFR